MNLCLNLFINYFLIINCYCIMRPYFAFSTRILYSKMYCLRSAATWTIVNNVNHTNYLSFISYRWHDNCVLMFDRLIVYEAMLFLETHHVINVICHNLKSLDCFQSFPSKLRLFVTIFRPIWNWNHNNSLILWNNSINIFEKKLFVN